MIDAAYYKNWRLKNKDKCRQYDLKYRHNNKDKRRTIDRKNSLKKYGLTEEQYNSKLLAQKNVCAICQKPETEIHKAIGRIQRLSIDHCHKTNKIRDLLCTRCNKALGYLKDNVKIILAAAEYIKRHE